MLAFGVIVGVESDYATPLVLERMAKFGQAVARNHDLRYTDERVHMWVQYTEWKYAWNAISNLHGRHVGSQDVEVALSNRSITVRLPSARKGNTIWYMKSCRWRHQETFYVGQSALSGYQRRKASNE